MMFQLNKVPILKSTDKIRMNTAKWYTAQCQKASNGMPRT